MWSQICIQNSFPLVFFNEWLEKHGIMKSVPGAQIALTACGILQLAVSLKVAIVLAVRL